MEYTRILTKKDAIFVGQNSRPGEWWAIDFWLGSQWRWSNFVITVNYRDDGMLLKNAATTADNRPRHDETGDSRSRNTVMTADD